jgi:hypothetical protein
MRLTGGATPGLSWAKVAAAFSVSWADVYRSVRWLVAYGL